MERKLLVIYLLLFLINSSPNSQNRNCYIKNDRFINLINLISIMSLFKISSCTNSDVQNFTEI